MFFSLDVCVYYYVFNLEHIKDASYGFLYRVEPLVCKEYITKRPVIIPYHKGGKRLHIGFQVGTL